MIRNFFLSFQNLKPSVRFLVTIAALAAILTFAWLIFKPCTRADFLYSWDDNINVTNNTHIRDISNDGLSRLFNPDSKIAEPRLTLLSFAIEYSFFSLNPQPYHIHNILLHFLNLILLFVFIRSFFKNKIWALLLILVFAIHPLHVEPVAWITGRKDLLFTFFYLLSLIFYSSYLKPGRRFPLLIFALLFAFLSLLSKIQALSLPLCWLALDLYYGRKFSMESLFEKFVLIIFLLYNYFRNSELLVLFIVFLIVMFYKDIIRLPLHRAIGNWGSKKGKFNFYWIFIAIQCFFIPFLIRRINMKGLQIANLQIWMLCISESFILLWCYVKHLYDHQKLPFRVTLPSSSQIRLLKILGVLVVIGSAAMLLPHLHFWTGDFKRDFSVVDRIFMASYALFYYCFHTLIPLNNSPIQPYPDESGLPWYYYLSLLFALGIALFTVYVVWKKSIKGRREILFGVSFFVINILMVLHFISIEGRVIVADRYVYLALAGLLLAAFVALENYLEKSSKKSFNGLISLMLVLLISYSFLSYQRTKIWKNGFVFFDKVIRELPDYDLAYINRGTLYLNSGKNQKAISDFDKAISLNQNIDFAYYNRALANYNLKNFQQAFLDCNLTLRENPEFYDALYLRAYLKNQYKNFPGALADYNTVLRHLPVHKLAWYNRGNTKKNLYDYSGSVNDYDRCLQLDSNFHMAWNAKGVAQYFLGDYSSSVKSFDKAIMKNPGEGNYYFNRGLSELKLNAADEACRDLKTSWGLGYSDSKSLLDRYCR
jgi:tetratricopeptide (TPR) repeat protein